MVGPLSPLSTQATLAQTLGSEPAPMAPAARAGGVAPSDLGVAGSAQRADTPQTRSAEAGSDFADYLNQSSVTLLERAQETNRFDPAAAILEGSVYKQPATQTIL